MSPLTGDDQKTLLRIAREAVEAAVAECPLAKLTGISPALETPAGAFVTLHKSGNLRGCIGQIAPQESLAKTVQEVARSAALEDPRFDPVVAEEISQLTIEISVLSCLEEIAPDQVEVGVHGLMVSSGGRRGLLLPQVAVEWHWNARRFLEETCRKAGLSAEAWRHGARVQAFTAQIYSEGESSSAKAPSAPRA